MSTENKDKVIMYNSPEAATYMTNLEGWVAGGRYWGKGEAGEQMARYAGCTHKTCECGKPMEKLYTKCPECRAKSKQERYLALPYKEWDGKEPIVEADGDEYFFDIDSLHEYLWENDIEEIDLLICDPVKYRLIDGGDIASDSHEDWEPSAELEAKINEFNDYLKTLPPHSWTPGKVRTSYKAPPEED